MAPGLLLLAVQTAAATMSVGATVVRSEAARPSVAVERGAVRIVNAGPAIVTTARDGDRLIVTLTY